MDGFIRQHQLIICRVMIMRGTSGKQNRTGLVDIICVCILSNCLYPF